MTVLAIILLYIGITIIFKKHIVVFKGEGKITEINNNEDGTYSLLVLLDSGHPYWAVVNENVIKLNERVTLSAKANLLGQKSFKLYFLE